MTEKRKLPEGFSFRSTYEPNAEPPDLGDFVKWRRYWIDRVRYDIGMSDAPPLLRDMCTDLSIVAEYALRFDHMQLHDFAMERIQHYLKGENENDKNLD